jgi:hypothetical protein
MRFWMVRRHRSLVIIRTSNKQVLGGVCYRPFLEQHFAEIAFFAITSSEQVRVRGGLWATLHCALCLPRPVVACIDFA